MYSLSVAGQRFNAWRTQPTSARRRMTHPDGRDTGTGSEGRAWWKVEGGRWGAKEDPTPPEPSPTTSTTTSSQGLGEKEDAWKTRDPAPNHLTLEAFHYVSLHTLARATSDDSVHHALKYRCLNYRLLGNDSEPQHLDDHATYVCTTPVQSVSLFLPTTNPYGIWGTGNRLRGMGYGVRGMGHGVWGTDSPCPVQIEYLT